MFMCPDHKEDLMKRLMKTEFSMIELQLYLDTHPYDTRSIAMFNQCSDVFHSLKEQYEKVYGPLLAYDKNRCQTCWQWAKTPWPWESCPCMPKGGCY